MNALALTTPAPLECAAAIVLAMSVAGLAHTWWLRSTLSAPFRLPLDGGLEWRGARIFGDNKTLAGFMAIVPAAGSAFALLGGLRDVGPAWIGRGLWALSPGELFLLGCWLGFWFMAGELPNSFLKRRLRIAPGAVPAAGARRVLCLILDRLDSTLALLLAASAVVPIDWRTGAWVLVFGPAVHLGFSALLFLARVKTRLA